MNTVLIVDDEVIAVRALKNGVDWASFGVDKVLTAYSMQQAQVIFMDTEIDLMLCDIEMPDASGLELFEWVTSYFPSVACLYVTCHPDGCSAKTGFCSDRRTENGKGTYA